MKKFCLFVCLSLVLSILVLGCAEEPAPETFPPPPTPSPVPTPDPVPAPTMKTLTYQNTDYGFSVEYPEDWDIEEDITGAIVIFIGPFIEETGGVINILIMSEELEKSLDWTLEDYYRVGEIQIEKSSESFNKVDQYNFTIAGLPAIVASFTYGYQGDIFMATQACFLREDEAWVIQYTAVPGCHDDYVGCMELVMSTFKFS